MSCISPNYKQIPVWWNSANVQLHYCRNTNLPLSKVSDKAFERCDLNSVCIFWSTATINTCEWSNTASVLWSKFLFIILALITIHDYNIEPIQYNRSTTVILCWSVFLRPSICHSDCTHRGCATNCQTSPLLPYIFLHHWLPISTRIDYKVLLIFLKAQMGVAPKYLCDAIRLPTSASSLHPLRSLDRRVFFVPRTKTTMTKSISRLFIYRSRWTCVLQL